MASRPRARLFIALLVLGLLACPSASAFASEPTRVDTASTYRASSLPAKPVLTVSSGGYTTINASWTAVANVTGYRLYRATALTGKWTLVRIVSGGTSTYADTGRTTGKTYYYRVRAYRTDGATNVYGSYSSVKSARAIPARPVTSVASAGYTSLKVSWPAVIGSSGYLVYRASSSAGTYSYIRTVSGGTSYTDGGRTTGKTYYYKVRAYHTEGSTRVNGSLSSAQGASATPKVVAGITLARPTNQSIRLRWSVCSGDSGYEIVRSTSASGIFAAVATTRTAAFTDSGVAANTTYFYKIRAYHTEGTKRVTGPYSTPLSLDMATALTHLDEGNVLTAGQGINSPNGQYTLLLGSDGNLVLRYKSTGRVRWSSQTAGSSGAVLQVLHDGNVAVLSASGSVLWSAGTGGKISCRLQLRDDGSVVVTHSAGTVTLVGVNTMLGVNDTLTSGQYIVSPDSRYLLVMQTDGNFVLYQGSPWSALWATSTSGNNYAVMQGDGNLVVYRVGGEALWASNTAGNASAWLALQNDANAVIYSAANKALWSRTGGRIYEGSDPIFPVNLDAGQWYGLTYYGHDVYGHYQYSAIDLNMAGDADRGQPIYAVEDGVMSVGTNQVSVRHTKPLTLRNGVVIGTWYTMYGHLSRNTAIANGATVTKGTVLGWVGNQGADNYHLHFVIFRNWNNDVASSISPWWLPGPYSSNDRLYADDRNGTRLPAGLYETLIFRSMPSQ